MIESGLVTEEEEGLALTSAGWNVCTSVQHRAAADAQAARILEQRETVAKPP